MPEFRTNWFILMTYRKTKVVVYAEGPWIDHFMDWRGGNHHHGRIKGSPIFSNELEAVEWILERWDEGFLFDKKIETGHHVGPYGCEECKPRIIYDVNVVSMSALDVICKKSKRGDKWCAEVHDKWEGKGAKDIISELKKRMR